MAPIPITDPGDPRVADYATLKDSELRKRYEHDVGVFIAEGPNVVRELLASPYETRSLLLRTDRIDEVEPPAEVPVYVAEREVLEAIVRFPLVQGMVGCGQRRPLPPVERVLRGARLVAVLEEMNDPENLGSVFRSARALGVDAVLIGPRSADPLYRRSVRVSMGHVLHTPFTSCGELPDAIAMLRAAGFRTVALTPDAGAVPISDVPRGERTAVLLGAEGPGLTDDSLAAADVRVRIPQRPEVDSLNVAVAAAIAFHELGAV